jgi:hypothetical protein
MKKLEQILKEDKYDITKDPKAEELIYYLNELQDIEVGLINIRFMDTVYGGMSKFMVKGTNTNWSGDILWSLGFWVVGTEEELNRWRQSITGEKQYQRYIQLLRARLNVVSNGRYSDSLSSFPEPHKEFIIFKW